MDTARCLQKQQERTGMTHLVAVALAVHLLVLSANPLSAYVWRCHSPHGDFWTTQPKEADDCSEYDSIYNPDAAPPNAKQRSAMEFTTPERGTKDKVLFKQQELDQMLAPIALYPDSLLSQIFMASTYPLEIVEAARWLKAHPTLQGDQAVKATDQYTWEPSVKSLVAFPNVLAMMDEKLEWTERVGDAFLSQQNEVMDTVQNLRQRASANGTLESSDQVRVDQQAQNISITSPDPQVVYVPYYDPTVIYGPWWWPAYPPVFWRPWPGYFMGPHIGYVWGPGVTVGAGFFFGAFDWPRRQVNVLTVNNFYYHNTVTRNWTHDPVHRRGVPYREPALRQQYGRATASPQVRQDFRGHYPSRSFPGSRESFGNHANAGGNRAAGRPEMSASSGNRGGDSRPHAFEGVGHGASANHYGARGNASSHRGGGGGGYRGGGGGHRGGGGHHGR
jgi:Protein of unknown function (DUF3300)